MDIELGTASSESTFTNVVVGISRQPIVSTHTMLDGSIQIQKASTMKRMFTVALIKPTSAEVTSIETEHDKSITLNFLHKSTTYTVRFVGSLDKSTGDYGISFTLQEV